MDDGKTWRWDGGLVGWNYRPMARSDGQLVRVELEDSEARRRWLGDLVGRLPMLLGDFGYVTEVSASARGEGARACVVDWREKQGPSTLLSFLQRADAWEVHLCLDLTCLDKDLEPLEVKNGADIWINIELTDSGDLDRRTDAPVYLRLELNADIYAPWSLGEVQDNAHLAGLNGPRLAAFLERIEREVPAELLEIHQDHHPRGTVGLRGFMAPGIYREAERHQRGRTAQGLSAKNAMTKERPDGQGYLAQQRAEREAGGQNWEARHVADLLDLSELTVKRMARKGSIPAIKVGRSWEFPPAKVRAWLRIAERGGRGTGSSR
jgi:excisionase family DNA binding protein